MRGSNIFKGFIFWVLCSIVYVSADNQTPTVSPIFPETALPFRLSIELLTDKEGNAFTLPAGLQAYNLAVHDGKWLLLNGLTSGLHQFSPILLPGGNTIVYVVDPDRQTIAFRSLTAPQSGLTQDQIESLALADSQFYQSKNTLYVTGGYGFRTLVNNSVTFDTLTAIDVPGLIHWVTNPNKKETAAQHIRQISNPIFQITGGYMQKLTRKAPTLLVFGQNFENQMTFYSEQIRRFVIHDDGCRLSVDIKTSKPAVPDPNYRRRDLNVVPVIKPISENKFTYGLVALSGVFTPTNGIWTVPVSIAANGNSFMPNPADPFTFKQGMNNYACPTINLFSRKTRDMYTIILGGISYGYFLNGVFQTDPRIRFINQVTTVKMDEAENFTQYLMSAEYPLIPSTGSNPGNPLLFGANASFIPANGLQKLQYDHEIFKLDKIKEPLVIGYIVGGIQSTLPDTVLVTDTSASPYIFKVIFQPLNEQSSCD
jgi:hypothetical protein